MARLAAATRRTSAVQRARCSAGLNSARLRAIAAGDALRATVAQGGWAILVFHDVLPRWHADGDASVATHNKILRRVASLDVWCAPMGQVFDYVESRWRGRPEPAVAGR